MAKFIVIPSFTTKGFKVREYDSRIEGGQFFRLHVNLKENFFELKRVHRYGASLIFSLTNPKKTLDLLGYSLNDFCDYSSCVYFCKQVADLVKKQGFKDIKASSDFVYQNRLLEFLK